MSIMISIFSLSYLCKNIFLYFKPNYGFNKTPPPPSPPPPPPLIPLSSLYPQEAMIVN